MFLYSINILHNFIKDKEIKKYFFINLKLIYVTKAVKYFLHFYYNTF